MKATLITLFIGSVLLIAACTRQPSVPQMLKDPDTRSQIMTAICNDSDMTTEMINRMSVTGASQKMLPMSCQMLGKVMSSDIMRKDTAMQNTVMHSMVDIISRDSILCDKTCNQMYQIPSIKRILQKKVQ